MEPADDHLRASDTPLERSLSPAAGGRRPSQIERASLSTLGRRTAARRFSRAAIASLAVATLGLAALTAGATALSTRTRDAATANAAPRAAAPPAGEPAVEPQIEAGEPPAIGLEPDGDAQRGTAAPPATPSMDATPREGTHSPPTKNTAKPAARPQPPAHWKYPTGVFDRRK
jgi:hypothetical protein